MRLKVLMAREAKHSDMVLAVGWANSDEAVSCGDDRQLLKWNLVTIEATPTFYPTDMHFFPRSLVKGASQDIFVLTSTDGKFHLISRAGRIEKTVDAHKGAALSVRWSYDGASIITCGEDGSVKMWSRNGMLRSVLAQNASPVYAIAWSGDNGRVLFACGHYLNIKPLTAQTSTMKWKAHEGVVLCVDWSANSDMIVSGAEDGKYKVWDGFGRPLYSSVHHDYPITSIAWNPEGELFAVGSFNLLRLCDKAGWSHSLEKLATGSVFNMNWSPDSTQLIGACANGHVFHAHVIEKRVEWHNLEVIQTKRKTVNIRDLTSDVAKEKLELKDRVTKMALAWDHLVIATTKQLYIFSAKNWNTPIIIDLKEGSVSLILMNQKLFLLADGGSISLFSYEGRSLCSLKLPGSGLGDAITQRTVALAPDTAAIRDRSDHRIIHLFDVTNGKTAGDGKINHTHEILQLAIDNCGPLAERKVAFIDKSFDCHIAMVKSFRTGQKTAKIGAMLQDIRFNGQANMLAGLQDSRLLIWPLPSVVFIDRELLSRSIIEKDFTDIGKAPQIISFTGNHLSIRRSDGAHVPCGIPPFVAALHEFVAASKWDQAIRISRRINEDYLWATLAGMAAHAKNFYAAEVAYGAMDEVEKVQLLAQVEKVQLLAQVEKVQLLSQVEKVQLLAQVREHPNKDIRTALTSEFLGEMDEADSQLVQSGHIFRAIMFNIQLFRWDRALELATKHKLFLDIVIGHRQRFLQEFDRKENNAKFLKKMPEVEIDWEHINEQMKEGYEKDQG